jgi:hypothetical protein
VRIHNYDGDDSNDSGGDDGNGDDNMMVILMMIMVVMIIMMVAMVMAIDGGDCVDDNDNGNFGDDHSCRCSVIRTKLVRCSSK